MAERLPATGLVDGDAAGTVLHLAEPVSFWGGVDATGRISDVRHPDRGRSVTDRVLVMTAGRGSSSSSAVLAELVRARCGPLAIVLGEPDPILTVGALVPALLYGARVPVAVVDRAALEALRDGTRAWVVVGAQECFVEVDEPVSPRSGTPRRGSPGGRR